MKENKLAYLFLCTVPIVMALSSVAGISFGELRHTGLFWIATVVVGAILLPLKGGSKISFPLWAWLPYYVFTTISLLGTRMDLRENVQIYMQTLGYPIVGMIASYTVTTTKTLNRFVPLYVFATLLIGLFCVYFMVGPGRAYQGTNGSLYSGFAERPAACSLIVVGAIYLATIKKTPLFSIFMWFTSFAICILSESRMATGVLLILWLLHPTLVNLQSRVLIVGLVIASGLAAFNTPIIQDRFFTKKSGFSGQGSIEDILKGKFDSAGRFNAWPIVYEKSFDYVWTGHGVGESAAFVFRVWAPMDKPHNEYLKMFFEGGLVGLATFVFGLVGTLANLIWILWKTGSSNWAASAGFMAWVGFILMSFFDNPLVYGNNILHPIFFLVGAANGIATTILAEQRNRAEDLEDDQESSAEEESDPDSSRRTHLEPIMLR
jgi:O-antigen ligase